MRIRSSSQLTPSYLRLAPLNEDDKYFGGELSDGEEDGVGEDDNATTKGDQDDEVDADGETEDPLLAIRY